jgi:hypothetical protein
MYPCMFICFLPVVMMSEQVVPSPVVQYIIAKFIIKKTWNLLKFWWNSEKSFGDGMHSRTQVYDWSKSFKEGWIDVENMQRLHLQRKFQPVSFLDSQSILFIDFLIEQWIINTVYCSKLLGDSLVGPSFKIMRLMSQKHLSPPWKCVSIHFCCDTRTFGGNASGGTATPCL